MITDRGQSKEATTVTHLSSRLNFLSLISRTRARHEIGLQRKIWSGVLQVASSLAR